MESAIVVLGVGFALGWTTKETLKNPAAGVGIG